MSFKIPLNLYYILGVLLGAKVVAPASPASLSTLRLPSAAMDAALAEARNALDRGEVPVGCALFSSAGQLLATGSNRTNERGNATAHAELVALEALAEKQSDMPCALSNLTLYVTCEPCIMCAAALVQTGVIGRIEFGCANPRFGGCGSVRDLAMNAASRGGEERKMPQVRGGIRAEECVKLLGEFYSKTNPNAPRPKKRKSTKYA